MFTLSSSPVFSCSSVSSPVFTAPYDEALSGAKCPSKTIYIHPSLILPVDSNESLHPFSRGPPSRIPAPTSSCPPFCTVVAPSAVKSCPFFCHRMTGLESEVGWQSSSPGTSSFRRSSSGSGASCRGPGETRGQWSLRTKLTQRRSASC